MFECYTDRARRILFFARYECSQWGSSAIEPEHLLLAILRESPEVLGIQNPSELKSHLESALPRSAATPTSLDVPLADSTKRVLAYAVEESERAALPSIEPSHIVLGLLREPDTLAGELLKTFNVSHASLRPDA